jgi:hypothetical protein
MRHLCPSEEGFITSYPYIRPASDLCEKPHLSKKKTKKKKEVMGKRFKEANETDVPSGLQGD